MAPRPLEYCCACDDPTGRAGQGEDSLYTDSGDMGPYCEDCWEHLEFWRGLADKQPQQIERLQKRVTLAEEAMAGWKQMAEMHAVPPRSPKCTTCDGHGLIGGFVNAESGYDSQPCPDCSPRPSDSAPNLLDSEND